MVKPEASGAAVKLIRFDFKLGKAVCSEAKLLICCGGFTHLQTSLVYILASSKSNREQAAAEGSEMSPELKDLKSMQKNFSCLTINVSK